MKHLEKQSLIAAMIEAMGYEIGVADTGSQYVRVGDQHISWHKWDLMPVFAPNRKNYEEWEVYGITNSTAQYGNQFCTSELECWRVVLAELQIRELTGQEV